MHRFFVALCACVFIAGCENIDDLSVQPKPIGEFALGHNIVVAPNLVMGPASREASDEEWIAAVTKAIDDRFSRYEGEQLYNLGVALEGYVLAQPGIPIVLSPKSALILRLTVWDDAAGVKLNEETEQITVLENLDGDSVVGSGLTKSAEEQMEALAFNAAKMIQRYIERKHAAEGWFASTEAENADEAAAATASDEAAGDVETTVAEQVEQAAG